MASSGLPSSLTVVRHGLKSDTLGPLHMLSHFSSMIKHANTVMARIVAPSPHSNAYRLLYCLDTNTTKGHGEMGIES